MNSLLPLLQKTENPFPSASKGSLTEAEGVAGAAKAKEATGISSLIGLFLFNIELVGEEEDDEGEDEGEGRQGQTMEGLNILKREEEGEGEEGGETTTEFIAVLQKKGEEGEEVVMATEQDMLILLKRNNKKREMMMDYLKKESFDCCEYIREVCLIGKKSSKGGNGVKKWNEEGRKEREEKDMLMYCENEANKKGDYLFVACTKCGRNCKIHSLVKR